MKSLEIAVLKTLAYADIFNMALTKDELVKFCIGHQPENRQALDKLKSPHFTSQGTYFTLRGHESLVELKSQQQALTDRKLRHAQQWLGLFSCVPWVQLVAVTGSVAGGTPKPDDDIDLLIITDKNRLWLSRLLLTIILNVFGKRRKPNDDTRKVNNKFCLNMWLAEDSLTEKHRDLFIANEIARIIPLLNRKQVQQRYLAANDWAVDYIPSLKDQHLIQNDSPYPINFSFFSSKPLTVIDTLAKKLQKIIMRKQTNETVDPNRLAFHPRDYRTEILNRYQQSLRKLNVKM